MGSLAIRAPSGIDGGRTAARHEGVRRIAGTALTVLACLVLVASAAAKLARVPGVALELGSYGIFGGRLTLVACLEIASVVLVLTPRTRRLGLLFVSAYMGGAMATHLQHGSSMLPPAIVLAVFWLATALRRPGDFSPLLDG